MAAKLKAEGAKKWRRVRGPTAAIIASLLDFGWDPLEPDEWEDDLGLLFKFTGSHADMKQFEAHIKAAVERKLWEKAAASYLGAGLA